MLKLLQSGFRTLVVRNTLLITASDHFISENGIVAVLGDENQFVRSDIGKIKRPLSFERGHMDRFRGNDAYRWEAAFPEVIALKYRTFLEASPQSISW